VSAAPAAYVARSDGRSEVIQRVMTCEICPDAETCDGTDCPEITPDEPDE
jgi:hypothetical protein